MKRHYVISDLHLGMGKQADNNWHPLEDFKSDAWFTKLLDLISNEGGNELIINGDWIDFPQLEPLRHGTTELFSEHGHRLCWTEEESLQKLESCLAETAHRKLFEDLRAYLSKGKKLTVLMGNHDPDLFWPKVQIQMRQLLSPPKQEQLEFVRGFVRRGVAHIEHGNQHCSPENEFADPDNIFHRCAQDGKIRLEMVWGTRFVIEYFNHIEYKFPYADNLKPEYRAIWLGIMNGWVGGREAAKFVKFLWGAGIPWSAVASHTLSEEAKEPIKLIKDIDHQPIAIKLLSRYGNDDIFRCEFDDEIGLTTATEWQAMNSLDHKRRITLDELSVSEEEVSATLGLFREKPEVRAARSLMQDPGVSQVIFGHTHTEIDGASDGTLLPDYFNTGTWTDSIDLSERDNRKRLKNLREKDLNDDNLFTLRLCYALVDVSDDNQTNVSLHSLI